MMQEKHVDLKVLSSPTHLFEVLPKHRFPIIHLSLAFEKMVKRKTHQFTGQYPSEDLLLSCRNAHAFGMFVSDCFHNTDYHAGFYVTSDPVAYNARVYKRTIGRNRPCLVIIGDLQEKIIVPTVVFNLSEKGKFFLSIFLPPL